MIDVDLVIVIAVIDNKVDLVVLIMEKLVIEIAGHRIGNCQGPRNHIFSGEAARKNQNI